MESLTIHKNGYQKVFRAEALTDTHLYSSERVVYGLQGIGPYKGVFMSGEGENFIVFAPADASELGKNNLDRVINEFTQSAREEGVDLRIGPRFRLNLLSGGRVELDESLNGMTSKVTQLLEEESFITEI